MSVNLLFRSLTVVAAFVARTALAQDSAAAPREDVVRAVEQWMNGLPAGVYQATIRAADGTSPLPVTSVSDRQFAWREGELYIGIGFSEPPAPGSSLEQLQATFKHLALDCLPVPGIQARGWETRLQTRVSSFAEGVTLESWKDGVLRIRVRTEFFAVNGRRTDILVPADAGLPEGTYFQVRRPVKADLVIEGRLLSPILPAVAVSRSALRKD